MSTNSKLAEAFGIFSKYEDAKPINVNNGELFAGPHPVSVSEEDRARLLELNWYDKSVDSCFVYKG